MKIQKYQIIIILLILLTIIVYSPCFSYEKDDHERINEFIANNNIEDFSLNDYLTLYLGFERGKLEIIGRIWWISLHGYELNLGSSVDLSVLKCLANGGRYEDSPPIMRSVSHFHTHALVGGRIYGLGFINPLGPV